MRNLILLIFFFIAIQFSVAQKPFALIELFTSEGCSSCPPAEELLNKIHNEAIQSGQDIYILAYHVDYWNKLGWKDPYSKFQFTTRQENYSRVLPEKEVYTPQAVINGTTAFIGSKEELIRSGIKNALSQKPSLTIEIKQDSLLHDTLYFSYSLSKSNPNYVLRIALTEDGLISKVTKGENEGKTLRHDCVVKTLSAVDNPPTAGNSKISIQALSGKGRKRLLVFVQHKQTMRVLGAKDLYLK